MTTQEKIIQILRRQFYKEVGELPIISLVASDIAPLIDKRDAIIEALEELILRLQKQMKFAGFSTPEKMASELRQKIKQLKSEI